MGTKQHDANIYDGWEPPIPFDTMNLPEFPVGCLPLDLKNYVLAVSETTQTPVDMAGVAILAVMATCVQSKYIVEAKADWREPLNLYGVIVGKPAERKSSIMLLLTKVINQYEMEWNENHRLDIEKNKTKKRCLEKEVAKLEDIFTKSGDIKDMAALLSKRDELTNFKDLNSIRLLADDSTPEALISLLADNEGKMSIISAEGGIFEIMQGRYSKVGNIDVFLKAHNGDTIKIDRKGREHESIENPCLTILLCIQPQILQGLMSNEILRGCGLTARFLYSIPTSKMGNRKYETESIPKEYTQAYKKLCYDLLALPMNDTPKILNLSKSAAKLSARFNGWLEPRLINELEDITDFAGKLHGTIMRIAGILHLSDGHTENHYISYATLDKAIKIGMYFLKHAKTAYKLMGADKQLLNAKYMLRQIEKKRSKFADMEITRYQIYRLCRSRIKRDGDMTPALELLAEHGYIREVETEHSGVAGRPPSPKYLISPYFMDLMVQMDEM